jgi:hypothetical protein
MFRFGWIEPTAEAVVGRPPSEIPEVARDLWRRLSSVTAESFNQGLRTEQAVLLAFDEGSPLQLEIKKSMDEWVTAVTPLLDESLKEKNIDGIRNALKAASDINWRFHQACAQRYYDIVSEHARELTGPFEPV